MAVAVVLLAVILLALATALTGLDASTAAGLLVGAVTGGSIAALAALVAVRARRRQSDAAALDRLEPLRRDRP